MTCVCLLCVMCACCLAHFPRGFWNSQCASTPHILRAPSDCPTCSAAIKRRNGGICCLQSDDCCLLKPSPQFLSSFPLPPVLDRTATCQSWEHWSGWGSSTTLCTAGGRYLQWAFNIRTFFLFVYTCTCPKSGRANCVQCFASPLGCQGWAGETVRWALCPLQIHPAGTGCAILGAPSCWGCSGRSLALLTLGRQWWPWRGQRDILSMRLVPCLSVPPCLGQHPELLSLSIRSQPSFQQESATEFAYPSHEMNFASTEMLWCGWAGLQRMLARDQKGPCHPEMTHAALNCFWGVLRCWAGQPLALEWENTAGRGRLLKAC